MNVFYNEQYKEQYYFFLPDSVLHLFTFLYYPIIFFPLILDFIKLLCTHDFSRVTFATELSINLVYKIIFFIIIITYPFVCCCFLQ